MPKAFLNASFFLIVAACSPALAHEPCSNRDSESTGGAATVSQPEYSPEALQKILHRLVGDDLNAFAGFTPRILVAERAVPNAFARAPHTIVLTTGLLDVVGSEDELAFVLAHELGHLLLGHVQSGAEGPQSARLLGMNSRRPIDLELEADAFSLKMLAESGYSPASGRVLLERLGEWGAEAGIALQELHPTLKIRAEQLNPRK